MSTETIISYLSKLVMQSHQLTHHKLLFSIILVEYSLNGTVRIVRKGTDLLPDPIGVLTREIVKVLRTFPPDKFVGADELLQTLEALGFVIIKSYPIQNQEKDRWFDSYTPFLSGQLFSDLTILVEMTPSDAQKLILKSIN